MNVDIMVSIRKARRHKRSAWPKAHPKGPKVSGIPFDPAEVCNPEWLAT